jgi:YHS domain-containing protein
MKYKLIILMLASGLMASAADTCPLMKGEENDPEEQIVVKSKILEFCCGSCVKQFSENKAYYIKAIKALNDKFTTTEQKELGVDSVKLLDQRTCPVYPERVVNPNSPSLIHDGKKIYFWSSSAIRRFKRDPEKYIKQ